jgi:DNA-binding response OmpR family regulator
VTAKLLVVDEYGWARQVLCRALERQGYDTRQVADLAELRQLLRQPRPDWRPDLTVIELVREHGNGFTAAAWLQAQGQGRVVLLSERADVADRLWARSRGIEHMLSRAGGLDQLCAQLRCILMGNRDKQHQASLPTHVKDPSTESLS